MNNLSDDAIDALLREQFEGPVSAEGFCDQVMERLPARRRRFEWPLATGIVAGAALCCFTLRSAPIARIGWRDWLSGEPSAPAITLLLALMSFAILAIAWTMAQADDRPDQPWKRFAR